MQLAQAAAVVLGHERTTNGARPRAVVARDPRASGEFIAAAVEAGLSSSGIDVYDAGVLPPLRRPTSWPTWKRTSA